MEIHFSFAIFASHVLKSVNKLIQLVWDLQNAKEQVLANRVNGTHRLTSFQWKVLPVYFWNDDSSHFPLN
jgi:hypothetical protein